jgi:inhibitor of cysteine peptidase
VRPGSVAATSLALILAACGGGHESLRLTPHDDGRSLELEPGAAIDVQLASNPSTGYAWRASGPPDARVLRLVSSRFLPAVEDGEPVVGRGGTEVWRFEAVAAGTTSLRLVYARSWEPERPRDVFTLHVRVPG